MKRLRFEFKYWRKPLHSQHARKRISIVRARNGNGSSPGWHVWFYTYPKGIQRGRMIEIYGRWAGKAAA